MIRAVIFDLNGVVINSVRLYDALRGQVDVDEESVHQEVRGVLDQARQAPYPSIYSLLKSHFQKWRISINKEQLYKRWFGADTENAELTDLIKEIKAQGIKVVVLSNSFPERTEVYDRKFPFIRTLFDRAYYSHETGFHKPDPRAYQKIFADLSVQPNECLYFDDSEKNVAAARSLGIQAFLYAGVDHVKEKIQELRR